MDSGTLARVTLPTNSAPCQNGAVVSRQKLEEAVYGWGQEVESNSVEVHLHNLRRKLAPELIRNLRGVGYRIAKID